MYSRVPECQVTTYYYVGFAYLMMRRYQDAIRVFANILLYIQRTKSMFQRTTYKYEMVRGLPRGLKPGPPRLLCAHLPEAALTEFLSAYFRDRAPSSDPIKPDNESSVFSPPPNFAPWLCLQLLSRLGAFRGCGQGEVHMGATLSPQQRVRLQCPGTEPALRRMEQGPVLTGGQERRCTGPP